MKTNTKIRFNIYRGTLLVGWVWAEEVKEAWKMAVSAVRELAFADGVYGESLISTTPGRVSYERGWFRAVNETRFDA